MSGPLPFALPPADALLLRPSAEALRALGAAGWRPWATPITFDAERRRLLNVDLSEPDLAWHDAGDVTAVVHLEADREGLVTVVEITAAAPVPPERVAQALVAPAGEPRVSGDGAARQWVWGPESGGAAVVAGEPVRLWVCAERAYGDRLWAVLSVVRRAS